MSQKHQRLKTLLMELFQLDQPDLNFGLDRVMRAMTADKAEVEKRLGDSHVRLRSSIVSNTPSATMQALWNRHKTEMLSRNVVFQEEDRDSYVQSMLDGTGP